MFPVYILNLNFLFSRLEKQNCIHLGDPENKIINIIKLLIRMFLFVFISRSVSSWLLVVK